MGVAATPSYDTVGAAQVTTQTAVQQHIYISRHSQQYSSTCADTVSSTAALVAKQQYCSTSHYIVSITYADAVSSTAALVTTQPAIQ